MNDGIAGTPRPKIDALAAGINRFIADLISLCEKGEEKPRHYFDVGVIGYTTDRSDPPNPIVGPVLSGANGTSPGETWSACATCSTTRWRSRTSRRRWTTTPAG